MIAWVTGGGTGIGRAVAAALYREGYRVVITGRRKEPLAQAAQEITSAQGAGDIWAVPGDASDPAYATELQRSVHERWGDIKLLINNAGENTYHSFQESSPEEFEQSFRINCMSAIHCTRAVLPGMLALGSGAIVNISSVFGKWASPTSSSYSVSKHAVAGFTESLRQELAGTGLHVMGVYPGFIRTAMTLPFVKPGSLRERMGKSPESMAAQILRGLKHRKRDIIYPWYVPLFLRLHDVFPGSMEKVRKLFGR